MTEQMLKEAQAAVADLEETIVALEQDGAPESMKAQYREELRQWRAIVNRKKLKWRNSHGKLSW